jgi:Na+-driven multidrug efflux pump
VCFLFAPGIVAFFVPQSPPVIAEGAHLIRIISWSFGFIGLQFALLGVLRAAGEMIPAMLTSLVSLWVLQIPLAYVLSKHTSLSTDGLWWAMPTSNVASSLIAGMLFLRGSWKSNRLARRSAPLLAQQEDLDQQAQMEGVP